MDLVKIGSYIAEKRKKLNILVRQSRLSSVA